MQSRTLALLGMVLTIAACEPAPEPDPIAAPTATIATVRLATDSGTFAMNSNPG